MCCVTGLSIFSVQCCVLHMNLCLAKSLTATIWRDVNSMSESVQGVGTQDVLQELNALTGHMGLPGPRGHLGYSGVPGVQGIEGRMGIPGREGRMGHDGEKSRGIQGIA